jgi:hypothetical protein
LRFWAILSILLSLLAIPAWCGSTLTGVQQKVLASWLAQHANYRLATDAGCNCAIDIRQMRDGYGNPRYALPDYSLHRDWRLQRRRQGRLRRRADRRNGWRGSIHVGGVQRSFLEAARAVRNPIVSGLDLSIQTSGTS